MNLIWIIIVLLCGFYALITGNIENFIHQLFTVPEITISLLFKIGSLIIIYNGIFKIAIKSGVIDWVGRLFHRVSYLLFPRIPREHYIHSYICSNITANLLGLGIASTPITLNTIAALKKFNNDSETASQEMITLLVLNITSFTIFPLTIITLRQQYNSNLGIKIWLILISLTFMISVLSLLIDRLFIRITKWDI